MSEILSFQLMNFKGAKDVKIDLSGKVNSPVITLVGLNESGKTTILEGISHFVTGDKAVSGLFEGVHSKSEVAGLIPIQKKAAFSGKIIISAEVKIDAQDLEAIARTADAIGRVVDIDSFPRKFRIERSYHFKDSNSESSQNIWHLTFSIRERSKRKFYQCTNEKQGDVNPWQLIIKAIQDRLPKIIYFPTFLVDMPSRIYLQEHKDEKPVNRYYRLVLQDILDTMREDISIDRHVNDRISAYRVEENSPAWLAMLFGTPIKNQIDSVFQKISNSVSREVIGSWSKIFQRPISARSISLDWNVDTTRDNMPYVSFSISDGDARYAINERSLGFRWFFSFLLFTRFKIAEKNPTIFVFDEPAANLHAKAQAELLKSFSRVIGASNRIIYSTHSHHMINPEWLAEAYIVENKAIDYDSEDSIEFLSSTPTDIVATPYRQFVSQYSKRYSYFQPVIEKLQYTPPEIIGKSPFLLLEGASDFYALKCAQLTIKKASFAIVPGSGAGSIGPQISMLLARGEKFLVLLDDDSTGRSQAEKYRRTWFLSEKEIVTLAAIDSKFAGASLESLISDETKNAIRDKYEMKSAPTKSQIGFFLAEACASANATNTLGSQTLKNLTRVIDWVENHLKSSA